MSPSDYPDDWRPTAADGPITLTVQGETFQVTVKPDGGCSYKWASGPNPGYGFGSGAPAIARRGVGRSTSSLPPIPTRTIAQHRTSIRGFLAEIDPDTGYMTEAPQ